MFQGRLLAICLAPKMGEPLQTVEQVEAVTGSGLVGDRYFIGQGTFSKKAGPDREVTLIESEALAGLATDYEIAIEPPQARRNLVTQGVPLNHLVGREFNVGDAVLRGIRLCEPCGHLEKLTAKKGIEKGLRHRGGLRAQIVRGGAVRVGDAIRPGGD